MSGQEVAPGMMNHDQYAQGIMARFDEYTWPPDYQPDAAKIVDRAPAGMVFEDGAARATLVYLNECGWQMAWLDAHRAGDSNAANEATIQLRGLVSDLEPLIDADGLMVAEDIVSRAELGDPSDIQSAVTANCVPVYWTTNS